MKTANEMRELVKVVLEETIKQNREKAITYVEDSLAPAIEKDAQRGCVISTFEKPKGIVFQYVSEYLESFGYNVDEVTHYFTIRW